MKAYRYKAKRGPHELVEGECYAQNQDEAVLKVTKDGLFPIEIKESSEEKKQSAAIARPSGPLPKKLSGRDLITLYRHLGRLVRSGVPILKALTVLQANVKSAKLKSVVSSIYASIREGGTLSDSLELCGSIFPPFDRAVVKAGETAGELDVSLERLIEHCERMEELKTKLLISFCYPALITAAGLLTGAWMLVYVIPQFALLFANAGQNLPFITKVLMNVSQFGQAHWIGILIASILSCIVFGFIIRSLAKKEAIQRGFLRTPIIGTMILKYEIIQFCRTLAILLANGVSVLPAIQLAGSVVNYPFLHQTFLRTETFLREGSYLSDGLKNYAEWPAFFLELIKMGEESGRLDESLREIADWYERDLESALEIGTRLLEPLLILGVGAVLGLMIMGLLLPIMNMDMAIMPQ